MVVSVDTVKTYGGE